MVEEEVAEEVEAVMVVVEVQLVVDDMPGGVRLMIQVSQVI